MAGLALTCTHIEVDEKQRDSVRSFIYTICNIQLATTQDINS